MCQTCDRDGLVGSGNKLNKKSAVVLLCLCLLVPGLMSCGFFKKREKSETQDKSLPINWLEISVAYKDGSLLPLNSVLTLTLEDVSNGEAPEFIGETVLEVEGIPPYAASLGYNPALIKDGHRYVLRAEIRHYDRMLYTNEALVDPFENETSTPLSIPVVRVPRPKTEQRK